MMNSSQRIGNTFKSAVLLSFFSYFFTTSVISAECITSGTTKRLAAKQYAIQCKNPRKDCDPIHGLWYCSSGAINANAIYSRQLLSPPAPVSTVNHDTSAPLNPFTVRSSTQTEMEIARCIDSDGDGWGWNGEESCRTNSIDIYSRASTSNSVSIDTDLDNVASAPRDCMDYDGDGWGWDGVASCKILGAGSVVERSATTIPLSNSVNGTSNGNSTNDKASEVPENCHKLESGDYHITELVTDVFLTAGQSNATGEHTTYDPVQYIKDKTNKRVLVWTDKKRWEIADPRNQTWHNGKFPSGKGQIFNHPGFQIGRAIAELDECRVVAFVATAAAGMAIDHWRHDREGHYSQITNTVTEAINALPVKHQVDMIWWMQGEADDDQIVSRYFYKLKDLIAKFRSESWFSNTGYFLANETGWHLYANEAIRMLRTDNDAFTNYSRGEDSLADPFPNRIDEPVRVHFNEVSLRKIGDLVAKKYLREILKYKNDQTQGSMN